MGKGSILGMVLLISNFHVLGYFDKDKVQFLQFLHPVRDGYIFNHIAERVVISQTSLSVSFIGWAVSR
jgi:hypothetical protein